MSDSDLSSKTMKIALAAFLHDIGKFAQRSRGDSINPGDPAFRHLYDGRRMARNAHHLCPGIYL